MAIWSTGRSRPHGRYQSAARGTPSGADGTPAPACTHGRDAAAPRLRDRQATATLHCPAATAERGVADDPAAGAAAVADLAEVGDVPRARGCGRA